MVAQSVIETVRDYTRLLSARYPVKRVLLYGSYARATERPDSDIDVAVVLDWEPEDVLQAHADMFRTAMDVDVRIEPVIVNEQHDPGGFYETISRYATVVYEAL